jgi:hypothetical protein
MNLAADNFDKIYKKLLINGMSFNYLEFNHPGIGAPIIFQVDCFLWRNDMFFSVSSDSTSPIAFEIGFANKIYTMINRLISKMYTAVLQVLLAELYYYSYQ